MKTTATQPSTFLERDEWLRAVLASDLPHVAARVALAIGQHLRVRTGRCDPSFAGIATASHVSERTVYRLVTLLEHAGWIAMQRGGRGQGQRNQYILTYPDTAQSGFYPDTAQSGLDDVTLTQLCQASTLPKRALYPDTTVAVKKRTTKKERRAADAATSAAGERERELALADPGALAVGGAREDKFAELLSIWKRHPHGPEDEAAAWKAFVAECSKGDPDEISDAILASGHRWVAAYQHEPNMLKPLWKWLAHGIWKHHPDKKQPKRNAGKVSLVNIALAVSRDEGE